MRYQKIPPSAGLKEYVRGYYFLENLNTLSAPVELSCPINPTYAIVFNYGSPYCISNNKADGQRIPSSFLTGISLNNYTLSFTGEIGCCGILLNGTTFLNALRIPPLNEIIDWRLDLQSVIGPQAEIIPQRLREANNRPAQITIIEDFLVGILRQRNIVPNQIDRAIGMIIAHKGMLSMDQLAATLCMSPRQLRRKFKEQVGIGPKAYARLKRFNYISHRLLGNPSLSWKEFIDYGGFYDQSHFIREFQDLSGDSPTAFVHRRQALHAKLLV